MKNMKRALRRHHIFRLKRKRRNYWGHDENENMNQRQLGIVSQTPKPCSCWMCGNPRRYNGEKSLQELRSEYFELFELENIKNL